MNIKWIQKIYNAFKITFYVLIILIIFIFAYYIIKRLIDKDKPSNIFGVYIVEVAPGSGSMYNTSDEYKDITLSPGDLLFIKPLDNEDYEIGMTITFYDNDDVITTHQIIEINEDTLITKGINDNNSEDEPIKYSQIIGKVNHVWRGFRSTVDYFTSPLGIIVTVGCLFGFNYLLNFIDKKIKKKVEETKDLQENE